MPGQQCLAGILLLFLFSFLLTSLLFHKYCLFYLFSLNVIISTRDSSEHFLYWFYIYNIAVNIVPRLILSMFSYFLFHHIKYVVLLHSLTSALWNLIIFYLILSYLISYDIIWYHVTVWHILLCYIILSCIISYHIKLKIYYIILYYIIL